MFSRISGVIAQWSDEAVIVETNGLGYSVTLPPCVAEKIHAAIGSSISLEIYAVLNIDGNTARASYYGFTNSVERDFFEALISVASIGPRSAARAFSQPMSSIARAIDRGDHGFLKTLPGIGQQKARDIVAKLQGKVTKFLLIQDAAETISEPIPGFADEALAVLLQLEYKPAEAQEMIRTTLESSPELVDAETLLAEIYRRKALA